MITIQLDQVSFAVTELGATTGIVFEDQKSGIRVIVPFEGEPWANFQRHVAANGKLPSILISPAIPQSSKNGI